MNERIYKHCPICGFEFDSDGVPENELRNSYWICDCCGCEYGYDDTPQHREKWKKEGFEWFNPKHKPKDWSPNEQLKNADYEWSNPIAQ